MQKNPMNANRKEKSVSSRTTSMNLNQKMNEKMRKAHRSISNKGIQKCTSFYRNGMQMRDGLNGMAGNLEEEIVSLGQLIRGDMR